MAAMVSPAHSPRRLERLAKEKLVYLVIRHSIPASISTLTFPQDLEHCIPNNHPGMDKIIMATDTQFPDCLPQKKLLLEHIQAVREWWENNVVVMGRVGVWRCVLECLATELEYLDQYCLFPLFRLLLQLLFSLRVGRKLDGMTNSDQPSIQVELAAKACPVFAEVLRKLKPFSIEELSTQFIIFGSQEPLQVILENSHQLRRVHLRKNITEETLKSVSENCPLMDTFVVEKPFGRLLVSVDCLYKTFFRGMDRDEIDAVARSDSASKRKACLSFPRLKFIDLGADSDCPLDLEKDSFSEFIYNVLLFYPGLESVTCYRSRPFVPKPFSKLPAFFHSLSYSLQYLDLEGLMIWANDKAIAGSVDHTLSVFPKIQHFTLSHDPDTYLDVINFARIWIPRFKCKALTIKTYFTLPHERTEGHSLTPYQVLLNDVGVNLTALQFHLHANLCVGELCSLLPLCPSLEFLGIIMSADHFEDDVPCDIQTLPLLKCLTVEGPSILSFSHYQRTLFNRLIQLMIMAAPALSQLELVVHHRPLVWLMDMAQKKILAGLEVLFLNLNPFGPSTVSVSFYVQLLELLPKLKLFMLAPICSQLLSDIKHIYHTTDLQLVARETVKSSKPWH
ncbi:uncharacterized protein LOC123520722 isoform X1 [Portunus trituberculatus]|uniref:uncharacterized protein LOC123520722 isoform X1 n=2 Tax=Portunus trituberculatus TaxID=210409 RepID=UPI001E1CCB47|nr:uncharacterized protein LOC123520722 isoform X1 [Portunus trituberculatus]